MRTKPRIWCKAGMWYCDTVPLVFVGGFVVARGTGTTPYRAYSSWLEGLLDLHSYRNKCVLNS